MQIRRVEASTFPVPFKRVFRHAQASRSQAENLIVTLHGADGRIGYGEGCPRQYVTGETVDSCASFVRQHSGSFSASVRSAESLLGWIEAHRGAIDENPAAFCAMEIAALDLLGKTLGCSVEEVLGAVQGVATRTGQGPGEIAYSAVLGDMPAPLYRWQLRSYRARGFTDFKVKLSGSARRDRAKLAPFAVSSAKALRVRLDANNFWTSPVECIEHLAGLGEVAFAVEEPLQAGDVAGCAEVARACGLTIIADESLRRVDELAALEDPHRWIANVRVSKMGGIVRSLEVVAEAARLGVGVIVGCQVGETSLLTRAGIAVISLANEPVVAAEGAFGTHLLSRDLTTQVIMFGRDGVLRCDDLPTGASGFVGGLGLELDPDAPLDAGLARPSECA